MVLLELGAIAVFAGLVSAWAMWVYPKLKDNADTEVSEKAMIYNQGENSYGLLPSDNERARLSEIYQNKLKEDALKEAAVKDDRDEKLFWDGEKYVPIEEMK